MASALNNLLNSEVLGKWTAAFDLPDTPEAEEINPDSGGPRRREKTRDSREIRAANGQLCRQQRWMSGIGSSWNTCRW